MLTLFYRRSPTQKCQMLFWTESFRNRAGVSIRLIVYRVTSDLNSHHSGKHRWLKVKHNMMIRLEGQNNLAQERMSFCRQKGCMQNRICCRYNLHCIINNWKWMCRLRLGTRRVRIRRRNPINKREFVLGHNRPNRCLMSTCNTYCPIPQMGQNSTVLNRGTSTFRLFHR